MAFAIVVFRILHFFEIQADFFLGFSFSGFDDGFVFVQSASGQAEIAGGVWVFAKQNRVVFYY